LKTDPPFATPRHVTDPAECYFYHLEELPGLGVVGSEWDLRDVKDAYLGGVAFSGRRVLEMLFLPDARDTDLQAGTTWWSLPPEVIRRMLGVLGFGRTQVTEHEPRFMGKKARLYTVVGTRTRPPAP
jgi:hypothetical protein